MTSIFLLFYLSFYFQLDDLFPRRSLFLVKGLAMAGYAIPWG